VSADPLHWLIVNNMKVSRKHAVIFFDAAENKFRLRCCSRNPVDVNGEFAPFARGRAAEHASSPTATLPILSLTRGASAPPGNTRPLPSPPITLAPRCPR
jgi:hypothetical protein